ncbi:YxlC family protein [Halalkalibacter kiskunsagensis]|uniref:YxlC family protein n=1 Tax=Halalkalibacter kiskunsagensis TaxID=1548599 RepID=A0ABV6K9M8_9BACI
MNHEDQERVIQKLQQDWEQLDELGDRTPSLIEIKDQIILFEAKKKKAFYKELGLFLLTAVLILSVFVTSVFQAPYMFIVIQVCAIVVAPLVCYVLAKREKKEGNEVA